MHKCLRICFGFKVIGQPIVQTSRVSNTSGHDCRQKLPLLAMSRPTKLQSDRLRVTNFFRNFTNFFRDFRADECKALIHSMPRRLEACVAADYFVTKYWNEVIFVFFVVETVCMCFTVRVVRAVVCVCVYMCVYLCICVKLNFDWNCFSTLFWRKVLSMLVYARKPWPPPAMLIMRYPFVCCTVDCESLF